MEIEALLAELSSDDEESNQHISKFDLEALLEDSDSSDAEADVMAPLTSMPLTTTTPTSRLPNDLSLVHSSDDYAILQEILNENPEIDGELVSAAYLDSILNSNFFNGDTANDDNFLDQAEFDTFSKRNKESPKKNVLPPPGPTSTSTGHLDVATILSIDTDQYECYYDTYKQSANESFSLAPDSAIDDVDEIEIVDCLQSSLPSSLANSIPNPNSDPARPFKNILSPLLVAEATEKKILLMGNREISSPLMVKRRMRPNMELQNRERLKLQQTSKSTPPRPPPPPPSNNNNNNNHNSFQFYNLGVAKISPKGEL